LLAHEFYWYFAVIEVHKPSKLEKGLQNCKLLILQAFLFSLCLGEAQIWPIFLKKVHKFGQNGQTL
jgi:hypothetical protein